MSEITISPEKIREQKNQECFRKLEKFYKNFATETASGEQMLLRYKKYIENNPIPAEEIFNSTHDLHKIGDKTFLAASKLAERFNFEENKEATTRQSYYHLPEGSDDNTFSTNVKVNDWMIDAHYLNRKAYNNELMMFNMLTVLEDNIKENRTTQKEAEQSPLLSSVKSMMKNLKFEGKLAQISYTKIEVPEKMDELLEKMKSFF